MLKAASRNESDFSDRLNESMMRISGDREFQISGPHTENAVLPNCFVRLMTAALVDDNGKL